MRTLDPIRLADHVKLISPSMPPGHKALIVSTVRDGEASLVEVEVTGGMGRARMPKAGTVPTIGQWVAYLPDPGWRPTPVFPEPDHTPWTHTADVHDSQPADRAASEEAAVEEWGNDS